MQAVDYAWPTIADYENDVGHEVNEAFRIGWDMARTQMAHIRALMPDPARAYCQACRREMPSESGQVCRECAGKKGV